MFKDFIGGIVFGASAVGIFYGCQRMELIHLQIPAVVLDYVKPFAADYQLIIGACGLVAFVTFLTALLGPIAYKRKIKKLERIKQASKDFLTFAKFSPSDPAFIHAKTELENALHGRKAGTIGSGPR